VARAERVVYVEDQYFWGHDVAECFETSLREHSELRVIVVIPLVPDIAGVNRVPQYLGRERAIARLANVAPGRVAAYGLENQAGTPVYVHAKVCVVDDIWASTGSDNFNRRSWTHDSELSAVVLDADYARDLRLTLAAEHLDRLPEVAERGLHEVMADCHDAATMFDLYAESAARLEAWHAGGRAGDRPPGRLRPIPLPPLSRVTRMWATFPLDVVHDPDGRPAPLRKTSRY
jgi:phosphatidylserine/phosphatidylglycerophosphate/cardiolipin synthase-like enzyme